MPYVPHPPRPAGWRAKLFRPPSLRRRKYASRRVELTPEQLLAWDLGPTAIGTLTGYKRRQVAYWIAPGRRRKSELSFHKLPVIDFGIGDESRFYTRFQDLLLYAVEWKMDIYLPDADAAVRFQQARVAILVQHKIDVVSLLHIHYPEES